MKKKKNKGWYCPACGKFNGEESKFCLYCGAQNAMQNNMRPAPKKQFKGLTVALGIVLIALIGASVFVVQKYRSTNTAAVQTQKKNARADSEKKSKEIKEKDKDTDAKEATTEWNASMSFSKQSSEDDGKTKTANDVGDGWDVSVYSASDINTEIAKEEWIITKGSVRFNVVKGRTYYIYVHSYHYSFPEGYTYQLATSFKGPKATPAKKTTNTSKKPVKMVTGVSLKVKKKKINIRFKLVSNVSKYQIMYSTKKSFKNKKVVTVRSGNVTIKKLKRKKTYFIRVRAISKNGKAGAWSVVKKVRVK